MSLLFEKYVEDYAEYRPDYPDDFINSLCQRLSINSANRILDLACGTGNLGRSLKKHVDARLVGVDRSLILLTYNKHIPRICALSEKLPFSDNVFDAVIVGQAFHWFDFDKALTEILRILKPGGGFVISWYRRTQPLVSHAQELDKLVRKYNPDYDPGFMDYNWQSIIVKHGGFENISFFHSRARIDYKMDDYVKFQRSKSYIGDSMSESKIMKWCSEALKILKNIYPDGIVAEKVEYFYISSTKIN